MTSNPPNLAPTPRISSTRLPSPTRDILATPRRHRPRLTLVAQSAEGTVVTPSLSPAEDIVNPVDNLWGFDLAQESDVSSDANTVVSLRGYSPPPLSPAPIEVINIALPQSGPAILEVDISVPPSPFLPPVLSPVVIPAATIPIVPTPILPIPPVPIPAQLSGMAYLHLFKPERFSGEKNTLAVDDFLDTLEMSFSCLESITDPVKQERAKVLALQGHLDGKARAFWMTLRADRKATFVLASEALKQRFPTHDDELGG